GEARLKRRAPSGNSSPRPFDTDSDTDTDPEHASLSTVTNSRKQATDRIPPHPKKYRSRPRPYSPRDQVENATAPSAGDSPDGEARLKRRAPSGNPSPRPFDTDSETDTDPEHASLSSVTNSRKQATDPTPPKKV
ncbi:MAG: hypothetical protein PHF14_11295, partial [Verrucomicrobiota bacterium]|nr:hypothetical protein [Verrucomicrobiota bacterium]